MRAATATISALAMTAAVAASQHVPPVPGRELKHIHGVVLPPGSQDVLLATHDGLFAVDPTGMARMISAQADDFMGFTASRDGRLFASGHPIVGGNIGIIGADGAGATWSHLSHGANDEPVDFHAMTVSPADAEVIYGSYGGIQVSSDGGRTWRLSGPGPDDLIDLAAADGDPGHLYAGTMLGLHESLDAGVTWSPIAAKSGPVTMVEVSPEGRLYAFVAGEGLFALRDSMLEPVAALPDQVLLHVAFDPAEPELLVAVTAESRLLSSVDGGRSWSDFLK
ncbi:WD40/YVTN/BNR-like repeat-containing protein [Devosia rhizoryzae]|uniref:Exo-alpha-sialidase n=1 Tax=Devosia rhizoryzae TaxID=2774137 RepID=A0ABX7C8K0_9HYPH|nr:sialidase family protein [Devosia rhizoryzae]QQR40082.1 exo-alpha-sialidase [Devosia rhizoryzae]